MCYYITAVLPAQTDFEAIQPIAAPYGLKFTPVANRHVAAQLPNDCRYVRATDAMCDCSTALGYFTLRSHGVGKHGTPLEVEKLRRKGWSETKIDRWIADKMKRSERVIERVNQDAARWCDAIHALLTSDGVQGIGVLLYWYDRTLETEPIEIARRMPVDLSQVDLSFILNMREDVLYEFRR